MGENALYAGRQIKIGTCENMYYLRADQLHLISPVPNSLDPRDREVQKHIRFRFPWPDEDGTPPGAFDGDFDRGVGVWNVSPPEGLDHGLVQFTARGYNVCLPCPESKDAAALVKREGLRIHRNEHPGPVRLVQQRFWEGRLVAVCSCGGCGARYRLETFEDAQPMIAELLKEAEQRNRDGTSSGEWYRKVAERIAAGYGVQLPGGPA